MSAVNLPDSLREIIELSPTRQALDDYLAGKGPRFISNVFSSSLSAPAAQREYDLFPVPVLPDAIGDDLLPIAPPPPPHWLMDTRSISAGTTIVRLEPPPPHWLMDTTRPSEGTVAFVRSDVAREDAQARCAERLRLVDALCTGLAIEWQHTLALYRGEIQPETWPWKKLYLVPSQIKQPSAELITELAHDLQAHHLLLLTARHELGYLHSKVNNWCARGGVDPDDKALGQADLARIAARTRAATRYQTAPAVDQYRGPRADAPAIAYSVADGLPHLYQQFYRWWEDVYDAVTAPRRCRQCQQLLDISAGPGRPNEFCSEACSKLFRKEYKAANARDSRRKRAEAVEARLANDKRKRGQ